MRLTRILLLTVFVVLLAGCPLAVPDRSFKEQAADKKADQEWVRLNKLEDEGKTLSEEEREWLSEYNRRLAKEATRARTRRDKEACP